MTFQIDFKKMHKHINFTNSKVVLCEVNGKSVETLKYKSILYNNVIPEIDPDKVKETTNLKTTTDKYDQYRYKGYNWYDYLNCSVRGISGPETLYEIMHLANLHNVQISMIIELKNGIDFII
jgi:hypothetical protein